jgi:DNA-binding SARP family transcriptional activator
VDGKITYHQQVSYCGKPRCRRCREGTGHGPYWYAYQTINGRTVRTYVGKNPPTEALQGSEAFATSEKTREANAVAAPDAVVRLSVLGQFTLERRDNQGKADLQDSARWQAVTDSALQHQRVRSLLTCLISSPGRKLGREQAIELLWPNLDFETASHRLDKAVHSLRQVFEPGRSRPATSDLLLTEHSTLQLAEQSRLWIDADAFDTLLAQARASSDPGKTEQLLEEALLLYGGEYVSDERDQDAVQARRESLQRSWIGLMLELADLRIAREAIPAAIDTLDHLLAIDPTSEAAVQRLVLLLSQTGRRAEALRIYQHFAALLKQEYRMAPLPETRTLYESARRGSNPTAASASSRSDAPTRSSGNTSGDVAGNALPGMLTPTQDASRVVEAEPHAHMQVGRSNQSRLVGREQELAALLQMLRSTEQTRRVKLTGQKKSIAPPDARRAPQCLLLLGDVGIGKTRLAEELGREARRRGWTIAWTRAYAQEISIPYRLWTESLRKAMNQGLWQRQEITRHPLIYQALRALLPELDELLPQMEPTTTTTAPEQEQLRLWEATRALLDTISESAPLLIVLDDLQWADSSSCELLAYLVRQLRGHPVLIAGTCRDIELPPRHQLRTVLNDLQREQAIETITVEPLSDEQIRALVSGLPEPAVQHIQSRAAGNPFFAEELARNIVLPGPPAAAPDTTLVTMPDTISAVLDLRLGHISSACQRMLVRAAVLGGSFEFNLLRAMESGPAALDEDALLDLLEEALQTGMITEEGSGTRITYHFWHPLLVSHLYDGLSAGRRASLHRRAAEVLRAAHTGREEEGAAAITYHLLNGGADSRDIAHYAELAGDRAYALSAYPEAEKHYRLVIEHLGTLPANSSLDERLHIANILERLGECTRVQGQPQEARTFYEQALEERSKRHRFPFQFDAQYEAQIDALLWVEIGKTWFNTGDNAQAQQCYNQAEQVLLEVKMVNGPAWASVHLQMSYVLWQESNYEKALQSAYQTLRIFEQVLQGQEVRSPTPSHSTAIRRTLAGDHVDLGRTHLLIGTIAAVTGENIEALKHLNAALAIYERHGRQRETAIVCCNIGDFYLRNSEFQQAQAALRRSLSIAERIGDIPLLCVDFGNLGIIAARLGVLQEAENYYNRGLLLAEQINDPINTSLWNGCLTTIKVDQGNFDDARRLLYLALQAGRSINFIPYIGFALVIAGQLHIAQAIVKHRNNSYSTEIIKDQQQLYLLNRAKTSLRRALVLEGLEAETHTEGQLALAHASFLSGETDSAQQHILRVIEEAERHEQIWLLACAKRLMGSILSTQGEFVSADACFAQALDTFRQRGMRLEEARTLRSFGEALLQRTSEDGQAERHAEALRYLQEARQLFEACHAALDLAILKHIDLSTR